MSLRRSEWTRPIWWLVAVPFAAIATVASAIVRWSSRVQRIGPAATGPAVYVNWHRHLPFTMVVHGQAHRWMMMLDAPYMAPIAAWARCLGLRLIRGATGAGGREALAELRAPLARGESVVLAVDGPAGPPFVVKPGCVQLARAAGVPIIPMAYRSKRARTVRSRWDRTLLVFPFDEITVLFGEPIHPSAEGSIAAELDRVRSGLVALDPFVTTTRTE